MEPKNGLYITSADFEQWQDYASPLIESYEKCMGDCEKCKKKKTYEESKDPDLKVKNITFVVTERCNLNCTYCFSGDTLVTMKDYSKKPIKDIEIGDKILAFNELSEKKESQNKLKIAKVEKIYKRKSETIKMYFDDGTSLTVSPNHPILARRNTNNSKFDYKPAGNFKEGQKVYSIPHICPDYNILDDNNYMIGYFIGMMMGDGSYKKYKDNKGYDMYKIRLAVKDDEIIQRMSKIMNILEVKYYLKDFKVSEKYEMYKPAIFANTKETYDKINDIIDENFGVNNSINYLKGFLAGIYDAEGHISKKKANTIRITNGDKKILKEIKRGLNRISINYKVEKTKTNVNIQCYNIRLCKKNSSLKFILNVLPAVKRKGLKRFIGKAIFYRKTITKIEKGNTIDVYNIGTSERTYIANDILVHNCYEKHKTGIRMSKEVAKQAVDFLFDKEKVNGYYDVETSPAVILEFIGGEPLLEIDLMDYIVEYFKFKAFELNHPWATNYMISLTTNGILYNDEKVQQFLKRNPGKVSVGITIDGNKELHDSCRVFPDGSGSYDIVEQSIKTWLKTDGQPQTKITLCPENVSYLNDALKNVWGLGIVGAFTNCVFEEGWRIDDAKILYKEMIKLADYLLEDKRYAEYYCSLFDDIIGEKNTEDRNFCGGNGEMLAIAPDGRCFPCIRFMKYSLSEPGRKEQPIGDIWKGLDSKEDNPWLKELKKITMSSQCQHEDNKKCLDCPIASGCALCTGYNYDKFGDPNHKATFICDTHKARVLANVYYWNKLYKLLKIDKKFEMNIPKEWALEIINENEYNKLLDLSK